MAIFKPWTFPLNYRSDPGEISRVASLLGDAHIRINYAYCSLEPEKSAPLVFLGVTDVSRALPILKRAGATAAKAA